MKKLLIIGGVVIVIILVLLVLGVSNLGPIIKTAVNTYGPKITKTDVSLRDVSISILSGQAKLKDFVLGNPKGFKAPHAMSVGSVYVDVDEKSLTGGTIIINKIEVIAPEITYEKSASTDNFKTLLDNVTGTASTEKSAKKQSGKEANGKKIIIRDFILKDGKVNLVAAFLEGKSVSASLPEIHLENVGEETGGTSPTQAFEKIFAALRENITSPQVTQALNESIKALGAIGDEAKKQVEGVKGDAKKQVESMQKDLKTDLDSLTGDAKKMLEK